MAPGKADEQVLFPEAVVEGYTVRPWTLAQSVALAPTFGALMEIARAAGVGEILLKFMDLLGPGQGDTRDAFAGAQQEIVKVLPGLLPKLLPHAPKILSVSLAITEEEAGAFDLKKATTLLLAIIAGNIDYLKNSFGPVTAAPAMAS
jgi:hypothetical protein